MGLYIVFFNTRTRVFTQPVYFSSKTFNNKIFSPQLPTFSDREFSEFCNSCPNLELLLSLWTLSTVLRTTLCAVSNTCGIKSTTNDVITYTWEVLHTTTANQHD